MKKVAIGKNIQTNYIQFEKTHVFTNLPACTSNWLEFRIGSFPNNTSSFPNYRPREWNNNHGIFKPSMVQNKQQKLHL